MINGKKQRRTLLTIVGTSTSILRTVQVSE
nr:MAG TPA: hypothetical protein [Caudoviricetes sp.]